MTVTRLLFNWSSLLLLLFISGREFDWPPPLPEILQHFVIYQWSKWSKDVSASNKREFGISELDVGNASPTTTVNL
jgi:hypothetical protein